MHFARSIVLGYHFIPKIIWGSFRGRREEKWGSFRGRFGDDFRVGIISGAVQISTMAGSGREIQKASFRYLLPVRISAISSLPGRRVTVQPPK